MTDSPFKNLPELPCDVAEALEQFKLCVIRHRSMNWEMIPKETMVDVFEALLEFTKGKKPPRNEELGGQPIWQWED